MRAVFFDRDNTLTRDEGYCYKVSDFAWIAGAEKALVALHRAGIPVFIVTNQGGIAKGLFTRADMQAFHDHLSHQAEIAGAHITDIAFCPHHPEALALSERECTCRKPQAGMLYHLAEKWQIDLAHSVMVGDRQSDIQAGGAAGCASYLYDGTISLDALVKTIMATHFTNHRP